MGPPISPLIASLFKEKFQVKALISCPPPPSLWLRFVDDTFVITKAEHSQSLLQHINSQDPHIKFTVEEPSQHGTLSFFGHPSYHKIQQYLEYNGLQKTYTHRPISTLGQQSFYNSLWGAHYFSWQVFIVGHVLNTP